MTGCLLIEIVGLRKIGEDYAETGSDCVAIFGGTQNRKKLLRGPMAWRVRKTAHSTDVHPSSGCLFLLCVVPLAQNAAAFKCSQLYPLSVLINPTVIEILKIFLDFRLVYDTPTIMSKDIDR